MPTLPRSVARPLVRALLRPLVAASPRVKRPLLELFSRLNRIPEGITVAHEARGGVRGMLVSPAGHVGPARILYLHGGAYEAGSPRTHSALVAALVAAAGEAAFVPRYRLAPEHPAPAARDDALAAYAAMVAQADAAVALAGDSAGGGLALATALAAIGAGQRAPAALGLISPWVDLTLSGTSYRDNASQDALLAPASVRRGARTYAAALGARDPVCSPLFGELGGLPPMLVHVGADELLRSDSEELARRADAAGVKVDLRVFDGLWHDFHAHSGMLADADEAVAELGRFLAAGLRPPGPH